jgi:hypothetical protein
MTNFDRSVGGRFMLEFGLYQFGIKHYPRFGIGRKLDHTLYDIQYIAAEIAG